MILRTALCYDSQDDMIMHSYTSCTSDNDPARRRRLAACTLATVNPLDPDLPRLVSLGRKLTRLDLDTMELALLEAVVVFSDRQLVINKKQVDLD